MLGDGASRVRGVALSADFSDLRAAHELPPGGTAFNFPHFFIIGFPKCATTSLHLYLEKHPQALPPSIKVGHYANASEPSARVLRQRLRLWCART